MNIKNIKSNEKTFSLQGKKNISHFKLYLVYKLKLCYNN